MLFKFLTGNSIGNLHAGLILSQFGGLLMIFMALGVVGSDEVAAMYVFAIIGVVRMVIPILMGNLLKGIILKIALWLVIGLSSLKLLETFVAVYFEGLGFIWYFFITGLLEVAILIHLLSPKGRS